jgi:hypothetical protein
LVEPVGRAAIAALVSLLVVFLLADVTDVIARRRVRRNSKERAKPKRSPHVLTTIDRESAGR